MALEYRIFINRKDLELSDKLTVDEPIDNFMPFYDCAPRNIINVIVHDLKKNFRTRSTEQIF